MMEDTFGFLDLSQTFVEIWSRKRKSSILSSNSRIQDLCNVKKKQLTTLLKTEKAFPFVPLAFSILVQKSPRFECWRFGKDCWIRQNYIKESNAKFTHVFFFFGNMCSLKWKPLLGTCGIAKRVTFPWRLISKMKTSILGKYFLWRTFT